METREVIILEPEAISMLDEMEREKLIKMAKIPQTASENEQFQDGVSKKSKNKDRLFGSMPGLVLSISEDFDEPLEDFAEYM